MCEVGSNMAASQSETIVYAAQPAAVVPPPRHGMATVSQSVVAMGRTALDWVRRRSEELVLLHRKPRPLDVLLDALDEVHDPAEVPELLVLLAYHVSGAGRVELHRSAGSERMLRRVAAWPDAMGAGPDADGSRPLCIPLPLGGQNWGELRLWPGRCRRWPAWRVRELATLGVVATAAEWAVRAHCNLGLATPRDPLTGLYNERFLNALLAHAISQASRRGEPLALVRISVALGDGSLLAESGVVDSALQRIARAVSGTLRFSDILGRFNDGSIAAVLPGANLKNARQISEVVRLAVLEAGSITGLPAPPAVALGVAVYPDHARDADSLLAAAGAALAGAQQRGESCAIAAVSPGSMQATPCKGAPAP